MDIIPFKKVGQYNFSDDYDSVKSTIKGKFNEDTLEVLDKKYPRIYIENFDLMINFEEDSKSIRFFEFFKNAKDVIFEGLDLTSESYSTLKDFIKKKDSNTSIEKSSFESEKFGLTISREMDSNMVDSVLIGSKSYFLEKE